MQGMIAEYERAKIIERHRRGKIHNAKMGSVNVLGGAPYGYHYIDRYAGGGQACYKINEEEATLVRKIFSWIGQERLSVGEICRRLKNENIFSPKGKSYWDRRVIWGMLKNPAYKGQAAFGKTKVGPRLPAVRPQRHSSEQPRKNNSFYDVEKENWIYIPVPAIIEESLFDAAQDQLAENKKTFRMTRRGAVHLLQGLVMCQRCRYAYYGKPAKRRVGEKICSHFYYRCCGTDAYRFGGNRVCDNKQIRADALETAVWEEVTCLLKNPDRIFGEYQRRIFELEKSPLDQTVSSFEKQENKLKRGISRLIDSYAQEHINKEEFEPKIRAMKQYLKTIESQKENVMDQKKLKNELTLITTNIEQFSSGIGSKLENLDWHTKRDIIRTLVKRVEIDHEDVKVVFRVRELAGPSVVGGTQSSQHCDRRN